MSKGHFIHKYLLVINAGSSSIKFAIYQLDSSSQLFAVVNGQLEGIGSRPSFTVKNPQGEVLADCILFGDQTKNHREATDFILCWILEYIADGSLLAIGHRIVHGGVKYAAPALIDKQVINDLEDLIPLAPLHQHHNLTPIKALMVTMPKVPQVACFDTAFHRTQPDIAQRFALPRKYFDEGIKGYGFHGLSYEYISSKLQAIDPKLSDEKIIVAHLGNGSSLCALQKGKSIATTMGFSPLDGLVMGTRCGQIDPGILLYLMEHKRLDAKAIEHLLYYESGLLGVSEISSDMRVLLASEDPRAHEAINLYVYRIVCEIGSLIAVLKGLDALIFTGGIGENSFEIRALVCQQLEWLGIEIDITANQTTVTRISKRNTKVSVWVIKSDENLIIAKNVLQLVFPSGEDNTTR